MCVQSQLEDQNTRLTVLESKHNTPEDLAALRADITRINVCLFGAGSAPDVPRSKSGLKVV